MKQFLPVILSVVILITSMGFTVSSHMCGGIKVKTMMSLGVADVSCGMEKNTNDCGTEKPMKANCCEDEVQLIQNDEDYTQQLTELKFSPNFLIAFVGVYHELFEINTTKQDFFNDHSPPPLVKDIPVIIQSFLI